MTDVFLKAVQRRLRKMQSNKRLRSPFEKVCSGSLQKETQGLESIPHVLDAPPSAIKRLCHELGNLKSPSKLCGLTLSEENVERFEGSSKIPKEVNGGGNDSRPDVPVKKPERHVARQLPGHFPLYTVLSVDVRMGYTNISVASYNKPSDAPKTCQLKGFWVQSVLSPGDEVMIIGQFDDAGLCVIDDHNNYLISHPDILISPTLIGGAHYCMRKALMQDMMRSDTNKEMFIGTLVHDLMQRIAVSVADSLKKRVARKETSKEILRRLLEDPRYRQDMYALEMTTESVAATAENFVPNIEKWAAEQFATPGVEIADIEEWIWSPRYGVKGRVDMTLRMSDGIRPLEIKTGKPSFAISHTGQVLLYTLLLSEKYRSEIDEGVLFYAKNGDKKSVKARHLEVGGLIQTRNEISRFLKKFHIKDKERLLNLPAPINNERACSQCPYAVTCALYHKTVEMPRELVKPLPPDHYMNEMLGSVLIHLSEADLKYFEKWMILLFMESNNSQKNISVLDLWAKKEAIEQNDDLRVFNNSASGLRLKAIRNTGNDQLIYTMASLKPQPTHLNVGDLVILREDSNIGVVMDLCTITAMEKEPVFSVDLQADRFFQTHKLNDRGFKIDKYVFSTSSMSGCYDGLTRAMELGEKAERVRKLFVLKSPPRRDCVIVKKNVLDCKDLLKPLSKSQQTAVVKSMMTLDYTILDSKNLADPSDFVVALLRALHRCCQSILFVCASNSVLDTVLSRLRMDITISLLRLGSSARTGSDVRDLCTESIAASRSFDEMCAAFRSANVVGTTNGIHRHPALTNREFDFCIIHECSLMLQPSLLGFFFLARKFVLIGDSTKSPNVRCSAAIDAGIQESITTFLQEVALSAESFVVV